MDGWPHRSEDAVAAQSLSSEVRMSRIEWPSLARVLAWTLAITFIAGTVAVLLLSFQAFGSPPEPKPDFADRIVADFEFQQTQWPIDLAGTSAFAIGFLALGGLGPVLGRLAAPDDARRGLVTAAFLTAGGLGTAAQLLWIGTAPVATDPHYCDCGLLADELMSRLTAINIVQGVQTWLTSGAIVVAALGLVAVGALGREVGMPRGWRWVSLAIAVLGVIAAILPVFDLHPFDVLLIALIAGILFPIWAIWLALRARDVWPTSVDEMVIEPSP
jgi:hypothetical protein